MDGSGRVVKEVVMSTHTTVVDRLYFVGVVIKGIDGLLELLVGVVLVFAPSLPHTVLEKVAGKVVHHFDSVGPFVSGYLENLDADLAQSGSWFLIAYLTAHGAIKVGLVYCLLRRLHHIYPVALAVLLVFLGYQIFLLAVNPTVGLALISLLDAAIIYLVYREYRELKTQANTSASES
jgi:uncharacterized membrane protein